MLRRVKVVRIGDRKDVQLTSEDLSPSWWQQGCNEDFKVILKHTMFDGVVRRRKSVEIGRVSDDLCDRDRDCWKDTWNDYFYFPPNQSKLG